MTRDYLVRPGDTLGLIADRELGPGKGWEALWRLEANRRAIEEEQKRRGCQKTMSGPNWIFPGTVLQMPERHQ
ncbi:LysM peptidoglycan-binding domain-containing protein [Jiella marina]|uniref:LysM peptidoglycan-binding domain-containing protein n=1 Tax=Jiella sp. LLJ827 TaxID=2917712 RepID=UPI00210159B9|nr:LysM peptidoglycan-binding domain-containing protein [Jiella sp. LLJ827]MCQ0987566.1 LysM peptidoglycan-binding domain-containing protein [Jiella sp. LLJ827]